ncbi:Lupus La protein [Artemisia annua]|uniref:Lupus La protein n=1 Tax=Artemisia annua TaxID=35608 RepID=A0A2U1PSX5_ARTAN|nr:Lupus La protein [Artemisia annua]
MSPLCPYSLEKGPPYGLTHASLMSLGSSTLNQHTTLESLYHVYLYAAARVLKKELLAIQQQGPQNIGFFGTRNMGCMHQELIEFLSYAMVITKNHIFTSGASGTNAAVIRGALRAERSELLTVEYYFSDINLATTDHLMRFISKDPEGYVPISVVVSFKKIKALVSGLAQLATILRNSGKLVVSEDGKKVKRQHPLTEADMEELQSRIIVAENLPEDHCHQNLMKIFSAVGSRKLPMAGQLQHQEARQKLMLHAFVEYETIELAEKAALELNKEGNWRNSLKVRLLRRPNCEWLIKYPFLLNITVPLINSDHMDSLVWRTRFGIDKRFSIGTVWEDIRPRGNSIAWTSVVWFGHCIPRHAFHVWLVLQRKLKTQDVLRQWDVGPLIDLNLSRCSLCELVPDSHTHLFFECHFSSQVWTRVMQKIGMSSTLLSLDHITAWLLSYGKSRSTNSIISKLVFAASSYFIWQERNARLFKQKKRSIEQVTEVIISTVRLKLLTFHFKRTIRVERVLARWKLPTYLIKDSPTFRSQAKPAQARGKKAGQEDEAVHKEDDTSTSEQHSPNEKHLDDTHQQSEIQSHEHVMLQVGWHHATFFQNAFVVKSLGEDHSNEKEGGQKKGRNRGRGKGRGRPQYNHHNNHHNNHNNRGAHVVTPPSSNSVNNEHPVIGKQPAGPCMPDGTRGFSMGRGKPISVAIETSLS